jgi:hypothetical protein
MTRAATSWAQVDLAEFWDGGGVPPPAFLKRSDDVPLLYAAKLHAIHGEPEAGKGWLAHLAAHELVKARKHVLHVDFEDDPTTAVERQRALGTSRKALLRYFHYVRPDEPLIGAQDDLTSLLLKHRFKLVILDGLTEAYTLNGLDPSNNSDTARWLQLLPRPMAKYGAAVLQIDHVVKDRAAQGKYAIGGQHKLAGIDVAYSLRTVEPFGRDCDGAAKLYIVKDRPGWVQRNAVGKDRQIADVRFASVDSKVSINLNPPEHAGTDFRPTRLMSQISRVISEKPGLSQQAIRKAVNGKTEVKRVALERLIGEGFVRVEKDGQANRHYPKKAFDA